MSCSMLCGGAEEAPARTAGWPDGRRGDRKGLLGPGFLGADVPAADVLSRRRGRASSGLSKPSAAEG
ncbi:hypothetical protein XFF6990_10129 [Xanthomonas citri pv. fuscans]|nr:hypothetical protein XFF6990_10129 [Xanthomonas citri pv. fuscans]